MNRNGSLPPRAIRGLSCALLLSLPFWLSLGYLGWRLVRRVL